MKYSSLSRENYRDPSSFIILLKKLRIFEGWITCFYGYEFNSKNSKKNQQLGDFTILFFELLKNTVCFRMKLNHVLQQIKFLGNNSMAIIIVSGLFVGLVLGLKAITPLDAMAQRRLLGYWCVFRSLGS